MSYGYNNNNNDFQEPPKFGSRVNDWLGTGKTIANGAKSFFSTGKTPWAAVGMGAKGLYNNITGKTPKEYSDVEQSIIFPMQGASMGAQFGPMGALIGGLYGLGHSFKDDIADKIGLSEDNFLYKLWDPIGMGDGKGFIDIG
jgi:hypothetical protein